ncbi:MAG: multidrug efflux SMR transporter [Nitrospinota bacterium]
MNWFYLVLAGLFEIGFTTSLKLSDNFSKVWPSISFLVLSILSFYFLTKAIQTIPLGTSYAVWTGIGAFGTAVVGIVFFMEPVNASRIFFLVMLIASIIGLKLVSN